MLLDPVPDPRRIGGREHLRGIRRRVDLAMARVEQPAAWNPRTARRVTQMRSRGIALGTSVRAEKQGPSRTMRCPDRSSSAKNFR